MRSLRWCAVPKPGISLSYNTGSLSLSHSFYLPKTLYLSFIFSLSLSFSPPSLSFSLSLSQADRMSMLEVMKTKWFLGDVARPSHSASAHPPPPYTPTPPSLPPSLPPSTLPSPSPPPSSVPTRSTPPSLPQQAPVDQNRERTEEPALTPGPAPAPSSLFSHISRVAVRDGGAQLLKQHSRLLLPHA